MKTTRKIKRINYNILDVIIGKEFEVAKDLCYFNGYLLTNDLADNGFSFYRIAYELRNNKVVKAYFNKKLN